MLEFDTCYNLTADANASDKRIDKYLSENFPELSRTYIQKLIKDGCVLLKGKSIKPNYRLSVGDSIDVTFKKPSAPDIIPEDIPLEIIYDDDDIIVVNKPKGMVVHPAPGHYSGTLVNALMYHYKDKLSGINGSLRPGIVHRIDKDTTGLLIVCKNDTAHRNIADQLSAHYKVLRRYNGYTYIECMLETGRTHQIRVHMAYIGHPLLGDTTYGYSKQPFKTDGQVLHAKSIGIIHPGTGKYIEFDSDIPEYFKKILRNLSNK